MKKGDTPVFNFWWAAVGTHTKNRNVPFFRPCQTNARGLARREHLEIIYDILHAIDGARDLFGPHPVVTGRDRS